MILEFSDWLLLSDNDTNAAFSTEEAAQHCTCAWCRNFYKTVDTQYPGLRYFLSRFGLDIEAPESLQPITPQLYQASYVSDGKILRQGSEPIYVDGLPITVEQDAEPDTFYLHVGLMNLPWVLEEDPNELPLPSGAGDVFASFRA